MKLHEITVAGHERLVHCEDRVSGLDAFIAVHSTRLGPAAGGCRMWPYTTRAEAREDVLRLARGMTYKNALAGLPLGGGKAVIIGDPRDRSAALMRAFGRFVERLGGSYYTAEDVGVGVEDMARVAEETAFVAGLPDGEFASGDPSPVTARGVYLCMRVAVERRLQRRSLEGVRVAVQGLGHVGTQLCRLLHDGGARLVVADVDNAATDRAIASFAAQAVSPGTIHEQDVDVFAPCALGGAINPTVIESLRARVVAGAANNQLADERCGAALVARDILYAPDYVINSGGIINVAGEILKIADPGWVDARVQGLAATCASILGEASATGTPPHEVADRHAERILSDAQPDPSRSGSRSDCVT